jgi:hypothetical protein
VTPLDDLAILSRDYPAWTFTSRYVPSTAGPGRDVYTARTETASITAHSIPSLREMLRAFETGTSDAG